MLFRSVNQGLATLDKSEFGPQIHNALTNITETYKIWQEAILNSWVEVGFASVGDVGRVQFPIDVKIVQNYEQSLQNYLNLLTQISNTPQYKNLVQTINLNWDLLCEGINTEVVNFNKMNTTISNLQDNTIIYSFISSLPGYAADSTGLGTDYFLYGLCQPNRAGDIVKSILNQYKNTQILANAGVQIRGVV